MIRRPGAVNPGCRIENSSSLASRTDVCEPSHGHAPWVKASDRRVPSWIAILARGSGGEGESMTALENGSDLTGQVALVTGASRLQGIGAAICRALAARGADVAFSHWRPYDAAFPWSGAPSEPEDLEQELVTLGVRAAAIECDLSNPEAEVRLLDEAEARLGPISILVNNAAYSTNDGYEQLDAATIDAHYAVNMRATMLLAAEFARRFAAATAAASSTSPPAKASVPCRTNWPTARRRGPSRHSPAVSPPRSRPKGSRSTRSIPVRPTAAGSRRSCATISCRGSHGPARHA